MARMTLNDVARRNGKNSPKTSKSPIFQILKFPGAKRPWMNQNSTSQSPARPHLHSLPRSNTTTSAKMTFKMPMSHHRLLRRLFYHELRASTLLIWTTGISVRCILALWQWLAWGLRRSPRWSVRTRWWWIRRFRPQIRSLRVRSWAFRALCWTKARTWRLWRREKSCRRTRRRKSPLKCPTFTNIQRNSDRNKCRMARLDKKLTYV